MFFYREIISLQSSHSLRATDPWQTAQSRQKCTLLSVTLSSSWRERDPRVTPPMDLVSGVNKLVNLVTLSLPVPGETGSLEKIMMIIFKSSMSIFWTSTVVMCKVVVCSSICHLQIPDTIVILSTGLSSQTSTAITKED